MPRIRWKCFADESQVRAVLLGELPLDTPAGNVRTFLTDQGLDVWEDENRMGCSAPVRRHSPFVSAKWLMEFWFRESRLAAVSVSMGMTGPRDSHGGGRLGARRSTTR